MIPGPGTLLDGGWIVDRQLRTGPSGIELRCHHQDDASRVATVKLFQDLHPQSWGRFQREARILAAVEHPALVRAELARLDADPPYLVLALEEGPDLREVLARTGAIPLVQALAIARDLAHLLAHLHGQATYHRDLQPMNIILGERGPVVVQLGIAREEGKGMLTTPGTQLGDVRYAPPEWTEPKKLKPQQWDLYALGLTLHAMLTGVEPFDIDEELPEADRAVRLTKRKRQVAHLDPGDTFPDTVRELVRSLTAVDPERRPDTAREVHHRLRGLIEELGGDPAAAAGPPPRNQYGSELPTDERLPDLPRTALRAPPTLIPASDLPTEEIEEETEDAHLQTAEDPLLPDEPKPGWPWWAPYALALGTAIALGGTAIVMALIAAIAAWFMM